MSRDYNKIINNERYVLVNVVSSKKRADKIKQILLNKGNKVKLIPVDKGIGVYRSGSNFMDRTKKIKTDMDVFMFEVKKIFPNANRRNVFLKLGNGNLDFCWTYGGISVKNYPDRYHKVIRRINLMARHYRKKKGFAFETMR